MLDVLLDSLLDSLKVLPFLFLAYLLIEYVEHRASERFINNLSRFGRGGPAIGAALGLVPQCGFSVSAANLYGSRLITAGTFAAVFVATSDEALPLLLAGGDLNAALGLLGVKFVMGAGFGFLIDLFVKPSKNDAAAVASDHEHCDHSIFREALLHTLKSFLFLLLTVLAFNLIVFWVGEPAIASVFLTGNVAQPLLAALVGFIPNCAPAIILTQLYLNGAVSFGALIAGLTTNAGIGLAALLRANRKPKENLLFALLVYIWGVAFGLLVNFLI